MSTLDKAYLQLFYDGKLDVNDEYLPLGLFNLHMTPAVECWLHDAPSFPT